VVNFSTIRFALASTDQAHIFMCGSGSSQAMLQWNFWGTRWKKHFFLFAFLSKFCEILPMFNVFIVFKNILVFTI